jgi:peptidyl-tRNA hydrolase, PTH1 family
VKQADTQPLVIIGLGNPGESYRNTRHNMGFLVVEAFAHSVNRVMKEDKQFQALVGKETIKGRIVHFLLPLTYMNLSGVAVRRYLDYFKLPIDQVIVVTDDIALTYGQLRLKTMGSAGGHNGLKSIETHLGTTQYMRLRMGIGHPGQKILTDYVLDVFSPTEQETLPEFIDRGVKVLQRLLVEGPSYVMNTVNTVSQPLVLKKEKLVDSKDLTKSPNLGAGEHA